MNVSKTLFHAAWILALTAGPAACRKKNDAKSVCRISTFTVGWQVYQITYNGNGKIISLTNGTLTQTYDYLKDTTIITSLYSGVFSSKVVATINASGLATNVRTQFDPLSSEWANDAYEYNGDEVSKRITTISNDTRSGITTYTWFNHNIISETIDSNTLPFECYSDKFRQSGDYLDFFQFLAGYESIRTKNLLKSFGNSTLNYPFGSDGNIHLRSRRLELRPKH